MSKTSKRARSNSVNNRRRAQRPQGQGENERSENIGRRSNRRERDEM
jgi:hypothetical protein